MDLITLANLSLSRLGTRSTIADLNENSPESRAFQVAYPQAKDETLEAVDWTFARVRRALSDLGNPPDDWAYRYAYPNDCITVRSIINPSSTSPYLTTNYYVPAPSLPVIDYEVALDQDAQGNDLKVIYCNIPAASVIYTKQIAAPGLFSPGFGTALSWAIGAQMAMPLTGNMNLWQTCRQMWVLSLSDAGSNDANQGNAVQDTSPDWMTQR